MLTMNGRHGTKSLPANSFPVFESLEHRNLLSLLGVGAQLGFPDVYYDATGTINYVAPSETASEGTLDSEAAPTSFVSQKGARPIAIKAPRRFELHLRTDGDGNLLGGVPGPDLLVEGWIDVNKNNIVDDVDYSGILLTGEVLEFGFYDSGGPNDNYDFRLLPTGGALMPFFAGKDIALVMTSLNSTFVGDFGLDFSGWSQGVLGPIGALRSSLAGQVLVNGGPEGIGGVAVSLTGTDITGQPVAQTTLTAQDGSYLFAGLLPGTYSIRETQPAGYLDGADFVGSLGGTLGNDVIGGIALGAGQHGTGYDFAEHTCDLAVSKSGPAEALLGETITYTYTVTNAGPGKATPVVIDDQLGSPSYVSGDADGDGMIDSSETWVYQAQYTIPLQAGFDTLTNVAVVSAALAPEADTNPANDTASWEVHIVSPATLAGYVWEDFNDDGEINFGEKAVAGETVALSWIDGEGNAASTTVVTDDDGMYVFGDLRPGTYVITKTAGADAYTVTVDWGDYGMNYNFAVRPQAGSTVSSGQTATIGFWQNKHGQALLKALNGEGSTQLGDWLAATFPNMYGIAAGANNLAGKTNAQVAAFYVNLFKKVGTVKSGPAKVDAQAMAVAFAVYVTNGALAGNTGVAYGFQVSDYGVGVATWNVGTCGAAFGVADNTEMTVLDIMLATDSSAVDGNLYDLNALLRTLANQVYTAINEAGDIG